MAAFATMIEALETGKSIRYATWGKTTRMYASGDNFLCQVGDKTPYQYQLSWYEIKGKKWSVVN